MTTPQCGRTLQQASSPQSWRPCSTHGVSAIALWHTYVIYLVRQGIDAAALTARVGAIPPAMLATLLQFAPPSGTRPPGAIDFTYPALRA